MQNAKNGMGNPEQSARENGRFASGSAQTPVLRASGLHTLLRWQCVRLVGARARSARVSLRRSRNDS
ncbi:MAG: hypothetical protein DBX39_00630 [Bacillota bacterium]|nr:MAG: hypothetical protein DBX39_00630 [Bacillota bacterium]